MTLEDILFYSHDNQDRQTLLRFLEMAKEEYGNITVEELYNFVKMFVKEYQQIKQTEIVGL